MRLRSRLASLVVACLAMAAVASCRDGGTGPLAGRAVSLGLRPSFAVAATGAAPITFVRLVAREQSSDRELGRLEQAVPSDAAEWPLSFDVRLPGGASASVVVTVELLSGGADGVVEWSGRVGPITVRAGGDTEVADVSLGRGSLDNLAVTSLSLTPESNRLFVGDSLELVATTGGATGAQVYFTSLDAAATVSAAGRVKGAAPGVARIVAAAGTRADTSVITVVAPPTSLAVNAGDAQRAPINTVLPIAPSVIAKDAAGAPVQGVLVTFAVTSGGGSLTGAATALTGADGVATSSTWRLGGTAGANTLTATVAGLTPVVFTATAAPVAAAVATNTGNGQTAAVNTVLPVAPSVIVKDAGGAPVAGTVVTFAVASGGGSLAGAATATTGTDGVATVSGWRLGTAVGANTLTATVAGLPAVTFTATATAGPAAALVVVSGDAQSGTSGIALANALVVRANDAFGNAVSGAAVTWTTSHDGTLAPPSGTTDAAGSAQTAFTPGYGATAQTVTASGAAGVTPVTFTVAVTVPPPAVVLALADVDKISLGRAAKLNVTLTRPAPAGGVTVQVTSGSPSIVSVDSGGLRTFAAGETTSQVTVRGAGVGTATLTGTATGYTSGTKAVAVELRAISIPATLNVPFGQTASLPITLTSPAPPGGLVVAITTSNAGNVEVQTPTVSIAAGAVSASATVFGKLPGPASLVATAPNFDPDTSAATTAASLDIPVSSVALNASFGSDILVRFVSSGTPTPAPSPGVTVNLAAVDPACVNVPATATIPTGLVDVTVRLTYAGTSTTPCSTRVRATATNIQPDSVTANVAAKPGISMTATGTVAAGLQQNYAGTLGATNHGGVVLRLTSGDPARILVATSPTAAGAAFVDIPILDGSSSFGYYVQAQDTATSGATITATATGFNNGSQRFTVVQPALEFISLNKTTTTLTSDNQFYVRVGVPTACTAPCVPGGLSDVQQVRGGGSPLTVSVNVNPTSVATLVTSGTTGATATAAIAPGQSNTPTSVATGGLALRPVGAGSANVVGTATGYVTTNGANDTVTVSRPTIRVGTTTVAAGLQNATSLSLGAPAPAGGEAITLTSDGGGGLLVSKDATTAGTASTTITVPAGSTSLTFYVQGGVDGQTGTGTVTATAPDFATGTGAMTVVLPAVQIVSLSTAHTTLEADQPFYARVGVPNSPTAPTGLNDVQAVRAGAPPLTVTFTSSAPTVAQLVTSSASGASVTAQIPAGASNTPTSVAAGGVAYDALAGGTTNVAAAISGYLATPAIATTVSDPRVTVNVAATGSGLQNNASFSLSAPAPSALTVRITSADPSVALVSPNATTAGTAFIDMPLSAGTSSASFYVQGVEGKTGTVAISGAATGYTTGSANVTIQQAAYELISVPSSTTAFSPDAPFYVRVGIGSGATPSGLSDIQAVRAGAPAPLTFTITSSAPSVAELVSGTGSVSSTTVQIPLTQSNSPTTVTSGGVAVRPKTTGSTTIAAANASLLATAGASRTMTVTAPAITLSSTTPVGGGLMQTSSGNLGSASQHGGITVTITSSDPTVALLAASSTAAGSASITIALANGQTTFGYWVHGVNGKTGTVAIQASAPGFSSGTVSQQIVAPAIEIINLPTSLTVSGGQRAFYTRVGVPNATNTSLLDIQTVRTGGGAITATLTTSDAAVGALRTGTGATGATTTVTIAEGQANSPTSATATVQGAAFVPVASGSTVVTATARDAAGNTVAPTVNATSGSGSGKVTVTVSP